MKKFKRILALFLLMMMLCAILPATAFSVETPVFETQGEENMKDGILAKPTVGAIVAPPKVVVGETLSLTVPTVEPNGSAITAQGWQIGYGGESWVEIDSNTQMTSMDNGKQLRYYATNSQGTGYSPESPEVWIAVDGVEGSGGKWLNTNLLAKRIAGDDRFGTATEISKASFTSARVVILVDGLNFPDALAATPLAHMYGAPVLMVTGTSIDAQTQAEIDRLKPNDIIILGGKNAVSTEIENTLKAKYTVRRLAGESRYGTAEAIANELLLAMGKDRVDTVVLAYGQNYPDALGVGPGAAVYRYPIIFTDTYDIPVETQRILAKADNVIIVGGTGVVSSNVQKTVAATHSVTRLAGEDRYDTCLEIQEHFFPDGITAVFAATGTNFADALTGGVAAARNVSPMILVDGSASALPEGVASYIKNSGASRVVVLGGTGAVSNTVKSLLDSAAK